MIGSATKVIALVPIFDERAVVERFGEVSIVGHTVERLRQCEQLDGVAVLHDGSLSEAAAAELKAIADHGVQVVRTESPLADTGRPRRLAARAFAATAWRGGLGGATCYDEVLAPTAMQEAMQRTGATAGLIVGAEWVMVAPELCDAVIERHRRNLQRLELVFTQAAVGLCGCVIGGRLMDELADRNGTTGGVLEYSVRRPQGDPIARDVCVQVEPTVRDAGRAAGGVRAVCDRGRWGRLLRAVKRDAERDGDDLMRMGIEPLAARLDAAAGLTTEDPRHVTVELTPRRAVDGPVVPQRYVRLDRADMDAAMAKRIVERVAQVEDVTLTLGGLGDALLHDRWEQMAAAAKAAGIGAVHVETDLLGDRVQMDHLLASAVDVVSVRINADTAATYQKLMGVDGFDRVLGNVEHLLNERRRRRRDGLPWFVPRLVKVAENVGEIAGFFDRWMYVCGTAVIDGPTTGCGRMPDLSVADMSGGTGVPRRPCRQLQNRMTILSDGRTALCDQDWLGEAGPGEETTDVRRLWEQLSEVRTMHTGGRAEELALCGGCREWFRG